MTYVKKKPRTLADLFTLVGFKLKVGLHCHFYFFDLWLLKTIFMNLKCVFDIVSRFESAKCFAELRS